MNRALSDRGDFVAYYWSSEESSVHKKTVWRDLKYAVICDANVLCDAVLPRVARHHPSRELLRVALGKQRRALYERVMSPAGRLQVLSELAYGKWSQETVDD